MKKLEKYSVVYSIDISKCKLSNIFVGDNISLLLNVENIGAVTSIDIASKIYKELKTSLSEKEVTILTNYFSCVSDIVKNTISEVYYKNSTDIPKGCTPLIIGAGSMLASGVSANIFSLFKDSLNL